MSDLILRLAVPDPPGGAEHHGTVDKVVGPCQDEKRIPVYKQNVWAAEGYKR